MATRSGEACGSEATGLQYPGRASKQAYDEGGK
jgi:hypothetical protein